MTTQPPQRSPDKQRSTVSTHGTTPDGHGHSGVVGGESSVTKGGELPSPVARLLYGVGHEMFIDEDEKATVADVDETDQDTGAREANRSDSSQFCMTKDKGKACHRERERVTIGGA